MQFFKLSGAGNDFIALVEDGRPEATGTREPSAETIAAWCRRGVSVGADGLFVLRRLDRGVVEMRYYNADGGLSELCLNGTRCAARLALDLGWARDRLTLRTGAGDVLAVALDATRVALEAPLPSGPPQPVRLSPTAAVPAATGAASETGPLEWRGYHLVVGVPHFVLPWEGDLGSAPVAELGPVMRRHPRFAPAGVNVHFARYQSGGIGVRSYERGVEAETLACGTGVLASVRVGLELGRVSLPARVMTRGGFELEVDGETAGSEPLRWRLAGDARLVARGELLAGAVAAVGPPRW